MYFRRISKLMLAGCKQVSTSSGSLHQNLPNRFVTAGLLTGGTTLGWCLSEFWKQDQTRQATLQRLEQERQRVQEIEEVQREVEFLKREVKYAQALRDKYGKDFDDRAVQDITPGVLDAEGEWRFADCPLEKQLLQACKDRLEGSQARLMLLKKSSNSAESNSNVVPVLKPK